MDVLNATALVGLVGASEGGEGRGEEKLGAAACFGGGGGKTICGLDRGKWYVDSLRETIEAGRGTTKGMNRGGDRRERRDWSSGGSATGKG